MFNLIISAIVNIFKSCLLTGLAFVIYALVSKHFYHLSLYQVIDLSTSAGGFYLSYKLLRWGELTFNKSDSIEEESKI